MDKTVHFDWELPGTLINELAVESPDMAVVIKQAAVLDWVRTGRISLRLGADLLDMTYQAFMDLMTTHYVPTLDYDSGWEQGTVLMASVRTDGAPSS